MAWRPDFNSASRMMKSLDKFSAAFRYVRGAVADPVLSKQLETHAHAVEYIRWTMPDIIDPQHEYIDCELTNLIIKAAKRDEKLHDALKLTGFIRLPDKLSTKPKKIRE
jgi:hypothetical protein